MTGFDWEAVFADELDKAIRKDVAKSGFKPDEWFTAGRGKGQGEEWWRENGAGFARAFGDWYESTPDAQVWIAPDGKPAIELGLNVKFGDVPVVVYIDLIVKLGSALVVTDLKTSSREPSTLSQLGIYASAVELAYGIRPRYGTHFMCKGIEQKDGSKRYFMQPVPLDAYQYSIEYYTRQFQMLEAGVSSGIFLPNAGDSCRMCGVNYACEAVGGADAAKYRAKG